MIAAPAAESFPAYPASWYFFGLSREVGGQPSSRDMFGRRFVAYRTSAGQAVILDGHCSHFGADLGLGSVIGDRLQCAFHHWQYGPDGRCVHIPAQTEIPPAARQVSYPVVERHGFVFFFNGPAPLFPFPFFAGCEPGDFIPSRPFRTQIECPWYLVGANPFDLQHFRAAHDRRLVETPSVSCPAPFARSATGTFRVSGHSLQDRITRILAGDTVTLSITDWCGNVMFTTATFQRRRSYGMVITEPTRAGVIVRVIVFVPKSRWALGRRLKDPVHAWIRRGFVTRFLSEDFRRLHGIRYSPRGLIDADRELAGYLHWLAIASHGRAEVSARP